MRPGTTGLLLAITLFHPKASVADIISDTCSVYFEAPHLVSSSYKPLRAKVTAICANACPLNCDDYRIYNAQLQKRSASGSWSNYGQAVNEIVYLEDFGGQEVYNGSAEDTADYTPGTYRLRFIMGGVPSGVTATRYSKTVTLGGCD